MMSMMRLNTGGGGGRFFCISPEVLVPDRGDGRELGGCYAAANVQRVAGRSWVSRGATSGRNSGNTSAPRAVSGPSYSAQKGFRFCRKMLRSVSFGADLNRND